MPLYEFRCQACGSEIEVLQKISDPPKTVCPSCGQTALVKKISAAGFHLKGTGWYATDFRGGAAPGKTAGMEAAVPPEAPAAGKTDAEPAKTKPADSIPAAAATPAATP